jgi:hypothetical protein
VNLTIASPRLTIAHPGTGRTYTHSSDCGSWTCRPPRRFMRIVKDPKSVCSPNAAALEDCGCVAGGARIKRTWQPDGAERRCREDRVFGSRRREVESDVKRVNRMALFVSVYDLRSWR